MLGVFWLLLCSFNPLDLIIIVILCSLVPARARLPARNSLVNEVKFLGLITQNG